MKLELTEKEVRALLEILPSNITHARQAIYHYEQVDQPTESDEKNHLYYVTLLEALQAIRKKLTTMQ